MLVPKFSLQLSNLTLTAFQQKIASSQSTKPHLAIWRNHIVVFLQHLTSMSRDKSITTLTKLESEIIIRCWLFAPVARRRSHKHCYTAGGTPLLFSISSSPCSCLRSVFHILNFTRFCCSSFVRF